MKRRQFIKGLGTLFLSPAIVKAENIMRINPNGIITPEDIFDIPPWEVGLVRNFMFENSAKIGTLSPAHNENGAYVGSVQIYEDTFPRQLDSRIAAL